MRLYTNPQGVYVSASGMPTSFLGVDAAGQSTATGAAVAPQMQLVMELAR
jgi:hypothetical protein